MPHGWFGEADVRGSAMGLISAAERGNPNVTVNAIYQSGASPGAVASAWFYGGDTVFIANAAATALLFLGAGAALGMVAGSGRAA